MRGYAEEGTTTTPFELLAMNGVDRYQLGIEALLRVDVEASEACAACPASSRPDDRGGTGGDHKLKKKLEELRAYVVAEGNDPPEILEWTWRGRPRPGVLRSPTGLGPAVNAWHGASTSPRWSPTAASPWSRWGSWRCSPRAWGRVGLLPAARGLRRERPPDRADAASATHLDAAARTVRTHRRRGAGDDRGGLPRRGREAGGGRLPRRWRTGCDVVVCEGTDFAGSAPGARLRPECRRSPTSSAARCSRWWRRHPRARPRRPCGWRESLLPAGAASSSG